MATTTSRHIGSSMRWVTLPTELPTWRAAPGPPLPRPAATRRRARRRARRSVCCSAANDLLTGDPERRVELMPDLIDALVAEGDMDRARAAHDQAIELSRALGDVTGELRADLAWGMTEPRREDPGWQERTFALIERAVDHFAKTDDQVSMAEALLLKGLALAPHDQTAAIDALKEAQAFADRSGDERIQVEVWDELGGAMLFGPTPYSEILEFTRREVEWARDHGIAFSVADGRLGEAYSLAALGQFDSALSVLHELIDFFAQLPGRVSQHGECYTLAGRIERDRGNPAAAATLYRKAMDVFEHSGHRRWWRNAAPGVAHAYLDMGRPDDARKVLDEIAANDEAHDGPPRAFRLEAEGRYLAATGDPHAGVDLCRRAVNAVANTGALFYEGRARETLAGLLAAAGESAAARDEFERARALYARKGFLPGVARVDRKLVAR